MGSAAVSVDEGAPSTNSAGEYRRRDSVLVVGDTIVSKRPLAATRLNDAAVDLVAALDTGTFRSPESVAAETGYDAETVEHLFDRLADRDFLEWRPARDPGDEPPVSIVVTVRNGREHLERCLGALAALDYPTYEVVVVDDGSTDGTREMAESHALADDGGLRVVSVGDPESPLGIGASRNRGVDAARHEIVAFTDADCRPRADWLSDLVPCLTAADLVGGRIRPAGGGPASVYEGVNSSLDMGAHASRVDPAGNTPYLATANLVGSRAVFEELQFPERNVAEDVTMCWRALDAGYEVVYTPTGVVEHAYREDVRAFISRRATYGASEALLASADDREDGSVDVPTLLAVLLVASLFGFSQSGVFAAGAFALAGGLLALAAGIRGWRGWQQYRRLAPAVSVDDLVESWGRKRVSTTYALARETTRYYAVPSALLGAGVWAVGSTAFGAATLAAVGVALLLPAVVEYRVHDPDTSRIGYAGYYLADHLGYQLGVYRGALEHRTLAHLRPTNRFRLVGF